MARRDQEIAVEIVYALPDTQLLIELSVPAGTSARSAITVSGILEHCPRIDPDRLAVGIFGERVQADRILQAGDRVEIYRGLIADPKEARRRRAARKH